MTKGRRANIPASVRQRLLNLAQQTNQDFGFLLTKYALERLLYRLSVSPHRDGFVLKTWHGEQPDEGLLRPLAIVAPVQFRRSYLDGSDSGDFHAPIDSIPRRDSDLYEF